MAAFQLFLGDPRGEALVKNEGHLRHPDDALGLDAEDAAALDIALDPYVSHQTWSHQSLDDLVVVLRRNIAAWRNTAIEETLKSLNRSNVESWMDSMIAMRIAGDRRIATASKVLALATSAQANTGTILFLGD
jgi:hypothetical protein